MLPRVLIFLLCVGAFFSACRSLATEAKELIVNRQIKLLERADGSLDWKASIDLGRVDSDQVVILRLELVNQLGRSLKYDGFGSSCSCTIASETVDTLEPNSSEVFEVKIQPQRAGFLPQKSASFSLYDTTTLADRVSVVCKYEITGFLSFSQPLYKIELREWQKADKVELIKLPFTYTDPIAAKAIKVECTGAFQESSLSLDTEGGKGVVLLDIQEAEIPKSGMYGNVRLSEGDSDAFAQCQLVVKRMSEYEFAPQDKVIFVWDANDEAFYGSGIVKVNINPRSGKFLSEEKPLEMSVRPVSNIAFEATTKQMDRLGRVHRVELCVRERDAEEANDAKVKFVFNCEGRVFSVTRDVVFLR